VGLLYNASKLASGMLSFGVLDVQRYPAIPARVGVSAVPAVHVYHEGGGFVYSGRSASDLVRSAMSLIPDVTREVNASWRQDMMANPSAILFAERAAPPLVWRAIAARYQGKGVRVGFANDSDLLFPFGISRTPAIMLANGTVSRMYRGKLQFDKVAAAMDSFFARRDDPGEPDAFLEARDFRSACIGGRRHCVLVKQEAASAELLALRRAHTRLRLSWLVGVDRLPYAFMKAGAGAWIYNPRRDGFAHAADLAELGVALERLENGAVVWTARSEMDGEL